MGRMDAVRLWGLYSSASYLPVRRQWLSYSGQNARLKRLKLLDPIPIWPVRRQRLGDSGRNARLLQSFQFLNVAYCNGQDILYVLHFILELLNDPALALNMAVHCGRLSSQKCEGSSMFVDLLADELHPSALSKAGFNVSDLGPDVRRQLVDNCPAAEVLLLKPLA